MNIARSALSAVVILKEDSIGENRLIKRFMKGIYSLKPVFKKKITWNIETVINYWRNQDDNSNLSMKDLTLKLVSLLSIITMQRGQTLHLMDINNCTFSNQGCIIHIAKPLKQTRVNNHLEDIVINPYHDHKVCVFLVLQCYISRTQPLRKGDSMFISFQKPYGAVSRSTISRWIKLALNNAGIDTKVFSAHSTRAASSSLAFAKNMPIENILRQGGWKRPSTFHKFYNKVIV